MVKPTPAAEWENGVVQHERSLGHKLVNRVAVHFARWSTPTGESTPKYTAEMTRRLSSDDLGEWGEAQFRALCAAGELVANKAERDRMGWDFLVQSPIVPTEHLLLDQRPLGPSCRVQVKTVWQRPDVAVKLTLSAVERLAKDPCPAFVVALIADTGADGSPILASCYVIHLMGDSLAKVLRRLRQQEVAPSAKPLNKQSLTFAVSTFGAQFEPNGRGLARTLLDACGPDIQKYIHEKGLALEGLGYEASRFQLKADITAGDVDELVDMMLGLKPAPASNVRSFDVRFGIPVAIDREVGNSTTWKIEPEPLATCTIRVRGATLGPPAIFRADIIVPAVRNVPRKHLRILMRSPFFTLTFSARREIKFQTNSPFDFEKTFLISAWRQFLRLVELVAEGELVFEVQADKPNSAPRSQFKVKADAKGDHSWAPPLAETLRQTEALLALAGAEDTPCQLRTLVDTSERIRNAYDLLTGRDPASMMTFTTALPETESGKAYLPSLLQEDVSVLYADYLKIGEVVLAFAVRRKMRLETGEARIVWRETESIPVAITTILDDRGAFDDFVNDHQVRTGITNLMRRETAEPAVE